MKIVGERLNRFSSMIIDKLRRAVNAKQKETTEVSSIKEQQKLPLFFYKTIPNCDMWDLHKDNIIFRLT